MSEKVKSTLEYKHCKSNIVVPIIFCVVVVMMIIFSLQIIFFLPFTIFATGILIFMIVRIVKVKKKSKFYLSIDDFQEFNCRFIKKEERFYPGSNGTSRMRYRLFFEFEVDFITLTKNTDFIFTSSECIGAEFNVYEYFEKEGTILYSRNHDLALVIDKNEIKKESSPILD